MVLGWCTCKCSGGAWWNVCRPFIRYLTDWNIGKGCLGGVVAKLRALSPRGHEFNTRLLSYGTLNQGPQNLQVHRTDVQSQSVQADSSLHTSFTVGFAMHRLRHELFVQTLTISTLSTIFSRQHFEIFFSSFQENIICTSCKLSPLHETSNPVFLVMKKIKKRKKKNSICRLLNKPRRRLAAVALGLYNSSLLYCIKDIL